MTAWTQSLGEQMAERRQQLGVSQAMAARLAKVSRTTWVNWETGDATPEDYNHVKIESVLRWERGSVAEAIRVGRPAVELVDGAVERDAEDPVKTRLRAKLGEVRGLTDADQQALLDLFDIVRRPPPPLPPGRRETG